MSEKTEERITMYKLAGQLSEALGKRVREQMLYNYRAKGLIKTGADGRVSQAEADKFIAAQVEKRAEREAKRLAEVAE